MKTKRILTSLISATLTAALSASYKDAEARIRTPSEVQTDPIYAEEKRRETFELHSAYAEGCTQGGSIVEVNADLHLAPEFNAQNMENKIYKYLKTNMEHLIEQIETIPTAHTDNEMARHLTGQKAFNMASALAEHFGPNNYELYIDLRHHAKEECLPKSANPAPAP